MSYCSFCLNLEETNVHKRYHDRFYGFPIEDDNELFGRLLLEINQAGLSWDTILKKEESFRKAYAEFDIRVIASFKEQEIKRLMNDSGIIRNKLKIEAAIFNAGIIVDWYRNGIGFKKWLDDNHPKTKEEWTKLFKKTFKFTGGEIVNEFLMSTGYLKGAHVEECEVFNEILKTKPKWNEL